MPNVVVVKHCCNKCRILKTSIAGTPPRRMQGVPHRLEKRPSACYHTEFGLSSSNNVGMSSRSPKNCDRGAPPFGTGPIWSRRILSLSDMVKSVITAILCNTLHSWSSELTRIYRLLLVHRPIRRFRTKNAIFLPTPYLTPPVRALPSTFCNVGCVRTLES